MHELGEPVIHVLSDEAGFIENCVDAKIIEEHGNDKAYHHSECYILTYLTFVFSAISSFL